MRYTVESRDDVAYLVCAPDGGVVETEADAVALVGACGEEGVERLLLQASHLPPAFFDLSTGLAGAILLRFNVYRLRAAVVIPDEMETSLRFRELAAESNRGREFGAFRDPDEAIRWLVRS